MNYLKQIKSCALLLLILFLTGCFAMPAAPAILPPPIVDVPEPPQFTTTPVTRGTVTMRTSVQATQHVQQTVTENLAFAEGGHPLMGIFVTIGDTVQAGDIVAALYAPEIDEDLEIYNRRRDRLTLALQQTEERRATALYLAEASGNPVDDLQFIQDRANILAEIAVVDMYLVYLRRLDEARYLRATIDGIVTEAHNFYHGMESVARRTIVVVAEQAGGLDDSVFIVRGSGAAYLQPGNYHNMVIDGVSHFMRVVDASYLGIETVGTLDEAFLVFADFPPVLHGRVMGRVELGIEQAENVLIAPTGAIRWVGERSFVYVLENGLRTKRNVQTGFVGNVGHANTEIVSGLYEGELVIR